MSLTELNHQPGSNKSTKPEEQGWMLIPQTLNQHFQGLKSERVSLLLEYQIYATNYQLMLKVQPQFTCSNPYMMITYAQELLTSADQQFIAWQVFS